jgi:hypothetical protein
MSNLIFDSNSQQLPISSDVKVILQYGHESFRSSQADKQISQKAKGVTSLADSGIFYNALANWALVLQLLLGVDEYVFTKSHYCSRKGYVLELRRIGS